MDQLIIQTLFNNYLRTSFLCKVNFFPPNFSFVFWERKFWLEKITLQRRFFQYLILCCLPIKKKFKQNYDPNFPEFSIAGVANPRYVNFRNFGLFIFLCFRQNAAQKVYILGIFFQMRPKDQFGLATPVLYIF
jgi:hypothetical protein